MRSGCYCLVAWLVSRRTPAAPVRTVSGYRSAENWVAGRGRLPFPRHTRPPPPPCPSPTQGRRGGAHPPRVADAHDARARRVPPSHNRHGDEVHPPHGSSLPHSTPAVAPQQGSPPAAGDASEEAPPLSASPPLLGDPRAGLPNGSTHPMALGDPAAEGGSVRRPGTSPHSDCRRDHGAVLRQGNPIPWHAPRGRACSHAPRRQADVAAAKMAKGGLRRASLLEVSSIRRRTSSGTRASVTKKSWQWNVRIIGTWN